MQPAQRRHRAALIDALLTQPQSFSFFQLVRLLDRWLAPADANARGVSKLHFRNSVSLSFPTSEVESLVVRARTSLAEAHDMPGGSDPVAGGLLAQALDETLAAQRSWRAQDVERIEITPAFMGLLGVAGALPLYYTEVLGAREAQHKDHAARAFMDVFSHRAVALFYEAWTKHRLAMRYEQQPQTRFVGEVLALAGLGFDSLRGRAGGCATRPWPVRPAPCSEGACQRCSCRPPCRATCGFRSRSSSSWVDAMPGRWTPGPGSGWRARPCNSVARPLWVKRSGSAICACGSWSGPCPDDATNSSCPVAW